MLYFSTFGLFRSAWPVTNATHCENSHFENAGSTCPRQSLPSPTTAHPSFFGSSAASAVRDNALAARSDAPDATRKFRREDWVGVGMSNECTFDHAKSATIPAVSTSTYCTGR